MISRHFLIITAAIIISSPVQAQDNQPILPLERVLAYVYRENPTILSAHYNLRATRELYPQAVAGWHPKVSAEANVTSTAIETGNFASGDGATTKGASVNIEQPLFRGFRTVAEMEAAQRRIAADEDALRQTQQDIFVAAAQAYMDVIRDRQLLDLQHQNVALLAKEKESVAARFEAGDITQTDVKQTEARYSKALADDAIAESRLRQTEAAFEKVTGLWPPESLVMPTITFNFPKTRDELVKIAAGQNPLLSNKREIHEAAEEDIRAAKSDFYPQVSAFASHIKEYDPQPGIVDESETSTIGLRARISLYEGVASISRVRQAKARANQRFVETIEAEQAVRADIVSQWRRYLAYDAEIGARELEVAAARYSAEGVREEARLGDRTVLDTLEAEQAVLDAQSALVMARASRIVTAWRLAAALGMLDAQKLGISTTEQDVKIQSASAE